ncbi:MAG: 50S ribosomal protein L15 [Patescibacteria group bacterium]|nr:50S ribosomal protein L15 [Patescibacteria group bacterium]
MNLLNLRSNVKKTKKRVGRGNASGAGTYSGRGMNGQSSRSGGKRRPGFEGGQTPLHMKMPKLRGFKNPNRVTFQVVNVSDLEVFDAGATVDVISLYEKKIIRKKNTPVKVLGNGELTKKLEVKVDKVSRSAKEKIEKAKGKVSEAEVEVAKKKEKVEDKTE